MTPTLVPTYRQKPGKSRKGRGLAGDSPTAVETPRT